MAHQRLISFMEKNGIDPQTFNHFDYVDAFQMLSQLQLINHPRKRKLVQQFAAKCLQKIEQDDRAVQNQQKVRNFLQRTSAYQQIKKQRLQALRFLQEKYDSRCKQLKFYPKINYTKATQKGRYWKDCDGLQQVLEEESINVPNFSTFGQHSQYSSINN